MGLPKTELSAVPLVKALPNVMKCVQYSHVTMRADALASLPIIGSFVNSSVDAAMQQYVAPRSLYVTNDLVAL